MYSTQLNLGFRQKHQLDCRSLAPLRLKCFHNGLFLSHHFFFSVQHEIFTL